MFVQIAPFSQSFDELGLTYSIPSNLTESIKIGQIAQIEIGSKMSYGVIYKIFNSQESLEEFSWKTLKSTKDIESIYNDDVFLSPQRILTLTFLANYYFAHIHHCIQLLLPKNLREKVVKTTLKFESKSEYSYSYLNNNSLTISQQEAYNTIKWANKPVLLFGLTWSGKTEIYIQIIKNNLDRWEQTLLLIPEIILWNQIADKIKKIFGEDVLVLNSTVTEAKRTKYWMDIYHNNAKIIVWTRSALFYPYSNLVSIIIDEEHDKSYISDNTPRYDSREVAEQMWVPLVLGSGTPSIKSMYATQKWKYQLVQLLERYNSNKQ